MVLSRAQIEKLAKIIEQHATWFAWRVHGKNAVSKADVDRLKASGLLPMDVSISSIRYAYVLGKLESLLKENEYKKLSWDDLVEIVEGKIFPADRLKIDAASLAATNHYRRLADDLRNNLYDQLSQATGRAIAEAEVRGKIKDVIQVGMEMQRSYLEVARDLVETLKETKRDWTRVAANELHAAHQRGAVAAILQGEDVYEDAEGEDSDVAVVHDEDMCDDCRRLYYDPKTGHPRIFKLRELLENEGTNYQRPWRRNARPVVPPLHPHCNGRIRYVPPGWGWNKEGRFTLLDPKAAYPEVIKSRQQTDYTCGPAALRSVFRIVGVPVPSEAALAKETHATKEDGTTPNALVAAIKKRGLSVVVQEHVTPNDLRKMVKRGPVIVAFQAWPSRVGTNLKHSWDQGHYSVVLKVTDSAVYLDDPGTSKERSISISDFEKRWHDVDHGKKVDHLAILVQRGNQG